MDMSKAMSDLCDKFKADMMALVNGQESDEAEPQDMLDKMASRSGPKQA